MLNKSMYQTLRYCSTKTPTIAQVLHSAPGPHLGRCKVQGWVKATRKQKLNTFLDVGDGSTGSVVQVVTDTASLPGDISFHSCVKVEGELVESQHPGQEVELRAEQVEVVSKTDLTTYPFQPRKMVSQETVRKHPTCKAKTNSAASLLRLRNSLSQNIHRFFQTRDFLEIHTPILTSNDCEGAGEVFRVEAPSLGDSSQYWDKPVFLTVSGQLHLEAVCNGLARVYTFNPAFRAERGRTRRHLSEFWMVEAEMAFMERLADLVEVMEDLVKDSAQKLLEDKCREDLELYCKSARLSSPLVKLEKLLETPLTTLTHKEVVEFMRSKGPPGLSPLLPRGDLGREHELWLCDQFGGMVAVVDWPQEIKPSYMRGVQGEEGLVSAVDLLVPGVGELCGGSLRESCPDILQGRMGGDLQWYVDLRREGAAHTGGFGLGFERLMQFLVGVEHIKDTVPFHRSPHSCVM